MKVIYGGLRVRGMGRGMGMGVGVGMGMGGEALIWGFVLVGWFI